MLESHAIQINDQHNMAQSLSGCAGDAVVRQDGFKRKSLPVHRTCAWLTRDDHFASPLLRHESPKAILALKLRMKRNRLYIFKIPGSVADSPIVRGLLITCDWFSWMRTIAFLSWRLVLIEPNVIQSHDFCWEPRNASRCPICSAEQQETK